MGHCERFATSLEEMDEEGDNVARSVASASHAVNLVGDMKGVIIEYSENGFCAGTAELFKAGLIDALEIAFPVLGSIEVTGSAPGHMYSIYESVLDNGIMRSKKKSKFPMYHDLLTRGPHL